jgi:hypothetical protein
MPNIPNRFKFDALTCQTPSRRDFRGRPGVGIKDAINGRAGGACAAAPRGAVSEADNTHKSNKAV